MEDVTVKILAIDDYFVYYEDGWKMKVRDYAKLQWKKDLFGVDANDNVLPDRRGKSEVFNEESLERMKKYFEDNKEPEAPEFWLDELNKTEE
jgi:hypothetical protein